MCLSKYPPIQKRITCTEPPIPLISQYRGRRFLSLDDHSTVHKKQYHDWIWTVQVVGPTSCGPLIIIFFRLSDICLRKQLNLKPSISTIYNDMTGCWRISFDGGIQVMPSRATLNHSPSKLSIAPLGMCYVT